MVEVENYIKRKASEYALPEEEQSKESYEIIIKDSLGLERLTSIEEFQKSYFPDDTNLIRLKSRAEKSHNIEIEITFGLEKSETHLELQYDGKSAREVTNGIAAEIISILKSYKTSNHWIHYSDWFYVLPFAGAMFTSAAICALIIFIAIESQPLFFSASKTALLLITVDLFFCTFLLLRWLKPYSIFETRLNERRQKQVSWLLLGFLGYILFTVVGVYFRNKLFGF